MWETVVSAIGASPSRREAHRFMQRVRSMGQYDARHSVPRPAVVRQTQSPPYSLTHVGRLGLAVLNDARLRRSALTVAVLAGLIVYGAADTLTEVPLRELADTLGSSYDSAYKATGRLARLGYVQLARAKSGQRRLSMRVVWPAVVPVPDAATPRHG